MDMTKFSTLIAMLLSASAGLPDEVQLFNGKDLDGWVAEGVKRVCEGRPDAAGLVGQEWASRLHG